MFQGIRTIEYCLKNFASPFHSTYSIRKVVLHRGKLNKSFHWFQRFKTVDRCTKNAPQYPFYLTYSIREVSCWKCGIENSDNFYCENCNVLQEPDFKQNYFDLFGLQLSYNIDSPNLISKYHKLQIAFHPDKHSNKSEKEKEISEKYSSLINKAYATLSNPLQRGLYILKMKGSPINEEGTSSNDSQLLIEILDWNDDIDSMDDAREASKITAKLNQIISDLTKEISEAFDQNDIEKARILLNKMKYYTNVWQKLKVKKQNLGIPSD
ncbi:iron-sulfur cluster co-chaperone protein HscB [Planococcus citri]|uniref:iron-sulfur cluster co-chaperone protein HscB n=1 Tax=Planococcus citri TaxID=170843 RepID=UPI0031F8BC44